MKQSNKLRYVFEKYGLRGCSRLADFVGIKSKDGRLFFIYSSFFSLGLGFLVYLVLAFWMKLKDMLYSKRTSVFDL
jgi:phage shock protein PspC (stress-responsive transcriptional regulator)